MCPNGSRICAWWLCGVGTECVLMVHVSVCGGYVELVICCYCDVRMNGAQIPS